MMDAEKIRKYWEMVLKSSVDSLQKATTKEDAEAEMEMISEAIRQIKKYL